MILVWYFAVWGMSGTHYHVFGPFDTQDRCTIERQGILGSGIANHVSPCWSLPKEN